MSSWLRGRKLTLLFSYEMRAKRSASRAATAALDADWTVNSTRSHPETYFLALILCAFRGFRMNSSHIALRCSCRTQRTHIEYTCPPYLPRRFFSPLSASLLNFLAQALLPPTEENCLKESHLRCYDLIQSLAPFGLYISDIGSLLHPSTHT